MDAFFLGARFLSGGAEAAFRVRAARATRVEIWIYAAPTGSAPILQQPMASESGGGFTFTVPVAATRAAASAGSFQFASKRPCATTCVTEPRNST